MKQDKLEKFLTENREKFNLYDPDPELWDKINQENRKILTGRIKWRSLLWKVAAVAVIFMISFLVFELIHFQELKTAWKTGKEKKELNIPELQEASIYYSSLIQSQMQKVQPLLSTYPDLGSELNRDFSELDSICLELKQDLKDNVSNQEVIEALIQNYRIKLTILEDLLNQLEKSDQIQSKKNTNYDL